MLKIYKITLGVIICLLLVPITAGAVETDIAQALPDSDSIKGWLMDGKVALFDRDTLFDHIDGETELYLPYGFELLAFARYVSSDDPQAAFDADIYKMGSLLDAFGMYANYRRKDDTEVKVGTEGTASPSQLLFYQDRYLVRLQASGTVNPGSDIFFSAAQAISQKLPQGTGLPRELNALQIPAVDRKSMRYIAQSLLGYDFFHKGIVADAMVNDKQIQVFLIHENSGAAARKTFDQYGEYLKKTEKNVRISRMQYWISLKAHDPLYGNVVVEQSGQFVLGAVRVKDAAGAQQIIEELRKRVAGRKSHVHRSPSAARLP